ncbi:MAG: hypothetical protein AABX79_00410 [Nanoarchaeota archaeon]
MSTKSVIGDILAGVIFIGLYLGLTYLGGENPSKMIPTERKVESGYVRPSKLEIKLEDINGNGTNETLLKYDGKSYLLKLDEQGIPKIQTYEVIPAKVIPAKVIPKQ